MRALRFDALVLPLLFRAILLGTKRFEVASERLRVTPDPSEVRLQRRDSTCDVALLRGQPRTLTLSTFEFGGLGGECAPKLFNFVSTFGELTRSSFMCLVRRGKFGPKAVSFLCKVRIEYGNKIVQSSVTDLGSVL